MGRKSTAEVAARRTDVRDMMLRGKGKQFIVSYINTHYGIAESSIERDITNVYKDLKEYFKKNKEEIMSEHIARYEYIYETCLEIGNAEGAMKALQAKEKLLQLYKDDPLVLINNNTLNLNGYSTEQLTKIREALGEESNDK